MRGLLAENLNKATTNHTVAAIAERNGADSNSDVADSDTSKPAQTAQDTALPARAPTAASRVAAAIAEATAAVPPAVKTEPAPLTSGVLQSRAASVIPGSSEPMKPVRVKTVQVKAGPMKLAAAGPSQPVASVNGAIPSARTDVPETSSAVMAKVESGRSDIVRTEPTRSETARTELPPQPPGFGTGNGVLGVLSASSLPPSATSSQALAYAAPQAQQPQPAPQQAQQQASLQPNSPAKPAVVHTGWIVQVGALESESEAQQRIEAARNQARGLLNKADPFTETVVAKDNRTLYRARFAGLDRDQAEAVCRALKRSDISCMTVHN
jgi:D-alanyl-D-alanine carboxypeptidase